MRDGGGHHVAVFVGQFPTGDLVDDARVPRAVRLHHALGQPGRAARELDGLGGIAGQVVAHGFAPGITLEQRARRQFFRAVFQMDAGAIRCARQRRPDAVDDDDRRRRGVQDAPDLTLGAAVIERYPDLAAGHHRQQGKDVPRGIARANGHSGLRGGVQVLQGGRQRPRVGREFGVGHDAVGAVQGHALRVLLGGAKEEIDRVHPVLLEPSWP
ncbi:hypothetical protein D3C86_1396830 [compost metagenome]